jgi:RNA recognition motif-containing protein
VKKESLRRREEINARSVYIRPIALHCTPGMLKELARESIGVYIPTSMKKKNKGFAFIEFKTPEIAEKQISVLNGKLFCGKTIIAAKATGGSRPLSTDLNLLSLFIIGLSREAKDTDLQLLFTNASKVKVDALLDGECLGTAIVEFTSEASALNAFVQNHNKPVRGKPICVSYSYKDTKDVEKSTVNKPTTEQTRKRQHSESSVNSTPVKETSFQSPAEPQAKKVKVTTPTKSETPSTKTPQVSKSDSAVKKTTPQPKTPSKDSSKKPAKVDSETKKTVISKKDETDDDSEEDSSDLDADALQALMDSDNNDSSDENEDDDEDEDEEDDEDDDDSDD